MRKEWTESDEVNMLAAALLASEDLTQQEIAEKLELKSSKIQRLLKKAKSKYLHQEPPRFLSHEVTDPLLLDKAWHRAHPAAAVCAPMPRALR